MRAFGGHDAASRVRETSLDKLAAAVTTDQDWHGPDEQAVVQKYRRLFELLKNKLRELKVFRVGDIEVTIYIVGRTPQGDWAGLKTWAVET